MWEFFAILCPAIFPPDSAHFGALFHWRRARQVCGFKNTSKHRRSPCAENANAVTSYPLPVTKNSETGSGVSQSVNNAHFNFSPLRCHRTRLQWKRVGPNWRARICANKKFGKQSWRHKTATHCSWNSTRGKLTAEPKIVGNGAKTEPQVLSGI